MREIRKTSKIFMAGCLLLSLVFTVNSGAQAEFTSADLNNWTEESYPKVSGFSSAAWIVSGDGSSVRESINGQPTLFYSDFPVFDTEVEATFEVVTTRDNDFIGFALGFQPGDTTNPNAEYLLVDWKQRSQSYNFGTPSCTPGSNAPAGLAVSRVIGVPTADEFWGHTNFNSTCSDLDNGVEQLARSNNLGNTGWADNTPYTFTFEYSATSLKVYVEGNLEIDIIGNFNNGRFAFYNFSQEAVNYNSFIAVKELSYTPVTPCRIVDTRKTSAGIIGASTQRNYRVFGSGSAISAQGGNSSGCPSPGGQPLAAHINMVAVNPTGKGNLQAFPVGARAGAGLSVNYNTIDTNLANAGTVKTVTGSGADITVASNFSSAHTAIDVLGYYYSDGDLLYTAVNPCRIVDTRETSAGIIGASTQRNFRVFGSGGAIDAQGGNPAGCPSPLGHPLAAHINMVAVDPTGKGNLQAFPVGAGAGAGLSVNYNTIDTNLANAGDVKTVIGTGPDITVASNFSSTHTAIDVLGYYYPDGALVYTALKPCRIVDTRKTSAGIIGASTQRNFLVFGSGGTIGAQGGNSGGCSSPLGEPLAVHINMVAVNPTGKGNLQAFPVGAGAGAGLSVNYNTIDTNLANAGTVKTVTGSGADITVASNFSSTHTAIDVLGYYYSAP